MISVLFVDDEAHVLDGLRDVLRRHRREWQMSFASSGEEALAQLASQPFDVVVCDLRLLDLDGMVVLEEARRSQPQAARIAMSGHTDRETALRTVPVAQQFLAKPCDPGEVQAMIERAARLRELLRDDAVRAAAGGTTTLPAAPGVYAELHAVLRDPHANAAAVAAVAERDPAITAKLLQLVNSAFFGLGRHLVSVREAVAYLGFSVVQSLAVSSAAFRAFAPSSLPAGFSIEALELHSLAVARHAASLLADAEERDAAFLGGLLHDIGQLVLADRDPGLFGELLDEARERQLPLHVVERERLGACHALIGGYLLGSWGLPESIVAAVARHHDGVGAPPLDAAAAVAIAELACEAGPAGLPFETEESR